MCHSFKSGTIINTVLVYKTYQQRKIIKCTGNDLSHFGQITALALVFFTTYFAYLFFTLPYMYTIYLVSDIGKYYELYRDYIAAVWLWFTCGMLGLYINTSINFLLYCIAGKPLKTKYAHYFL